MKKKYIKRRLFACFAAALVVAQAAPAAAVFAGDAETAENVSEQVIPFNQTAFPDGEYNTDGSRDIYVSGGGRHRPAIHCDKVIVSGGLAFAIITLDSPTYGYISTDDDFDHVINEHKKEVDAAPLRIKSVHLNDSTSTFNIPVRLNEDFEFIAWSDSVESWISPYRVHIDIAKSDITVKTTDEAGNEIGAQYSVKVKNTGAGVNVTGAGATLVNGVEYTIEAKSGDMTGSLDYIPGGDSVVTVVLKKPAEKEKSTPSKDASDNNKKDIDKKDTGKDQTGNRQEQKNNSQDTPGNSKNGQNPAGNKKDSGKKTNNNSRHTVPYASGASPASGNDYIIDDGTYEVMYKDADSVRFNIKKVVLKAKNGAYTADVTLNGTGYGYVYPGNNAMAMSVPQSMWSPAWINDQGKYTYTITVPYLDKPFTLASRSVRDGIWYDNQHEMIIYSRKSDGSALPVHRGARDTSQQSVVGTGPRVQVLDNSSNSSAGKITQNSGGSHSGASGTTAASSAPATADIDSSTGLADGVYKPDAFSWSGGSGHINITCDQVIVKGGNTFARITISSAYYQYVKSGGQTITDVVHGPDSSTFVIPVELNKNNRIAALTTKLSQPYEIGYTIYVGLNAAKNAGKGGSGANDTGTSGGDSSKVLSPEDMIAVDKQYDELDEKVPEIIGLNYESQTEVEYSDLFKIFNYEDGYTLIEVDVNKGTMLDPEVMKEEGIDIEEEKKKEEEEEKKKEAEKKEEEKSKSGEEDGEDSKTESIEEQKTALYKNNIIKYLLIPEDGEVPAGLDKQVILVKKPADKTAVTSPDALVDLDKLGLTDVITSVGMDEKDIKVKSIKEELKKAQEADKKNKGTKDSEKEKKDDGKDDKKNKEDEIKVDSVGSYDNISYKKLVKRANNFLIEDSRILPQAEDEEEETSEGKTVKDEIKSEKKGSSVKTGKENEKQKEEMTESEKKEAAHKKYEEAKKQIEEFYKLGKFSMQLEVGVLPDRSRDEKNDLAKAEWLKVLGCIYDKEKEAEKLYEEVIQKATEKEKEDAKELLKNNKE